MKDVAKNVIERINRDVGSDIKNLHNCKYITSEYAKRVGEIEAEVSGILFICVFPCIKVLFLLSFQLLVEGNIPSTIKSALAQCRDSHEIIQLETAKIDQFQEKLSTKLNGYHVILEGVTKQLDKIRSLQHLVEYFKILKDIQEVRFVNDHFGHTIKILFTLALQFICTLYYTVKVYQQTSKMTKKQSVYIFHSMAAPIQRIVLSAG